MPLTRKIYAYTFGPGFLGGNTGGLIGILTMLFYYLSSDPSWDKEFLRQWLFVPAAGWFAAMIGGLSARDEFLREDWANHRIAVGVVASSIIGLVAMVLTFDPLVGLGGIVGGALGAAADVFFHGNKLESDF